MPVHYGGNRKKPMKPMEKKMVAVIMKPMMKPKKDLSARQKALMKEHKAHHTKKHMDMMTKLMKQGHCFEQAHEKTMKSVGK